MISNRKKNYTSQAAVEAIEEAEAAGEMNEETEEEDVEIGMDLEHAMYATKKDILQKTAQMLRPLATVVEKV